MEDRFQTLLDMYRLIMVAYRSNDRKGQSPLGVEEEFRGREQLLEDIPSMINDEKARKKDTEAEKEAQLVAACGVRHSSYSLSYFLQLSLQHQCLTSTKSYHTL